MSKEFNVLDFLAKMILGRSFGGWFVMANTGRHDDAGHPILRCRCVCGSLCDLGQMAIITGKTTHCGCLNSIFVVLGIRGQTKRDGNRPCYTKEYTAWKAMRERCRNEKFFKNYATKGVTVCTRWQESFDAFLEGMGPAPSPDHTIDRIDPNGNYEPGNCRWAGWHEQSRNKRRSMRISWNDISLTCGAWSELTGIPADILRLRIRSGWNAFDTLSTPPDYTKRAGGHRFKEMAEAAKRIRKLPPFKVPKGKHRRVNLGSMPVILNFSRVRKWPPIIRLHKASGQAFVAVHEKNYYLGKYGSQAVQTNFTKLMERFADAMSAQL